MNLIYRNETLRRRLTELVDAKTLTISTVANAIELTNSSVYVWKSGKIDWSQDRLDNIEELFATYQSSSEATADSSDDSEPEEKVEFVEAPLAVKDDAAETPKLSPFRAMLEPIMVSAVRKRLVDLGVAISDNIVIRVELEWSTH